MEAYCFQAYADALEVIPTTLAENAGLNPIAIVTELRNRHALGDRNAGINVRKVRHKAKDFSMKLIMLQTGLDLQYPRRRSRPTAFGQHECYRTLNRDRLSVTEDR